jgi:hypothetical protein
MARIFQRTKSRVARILLGTAIGGSVLAGGIALGATPAFANTQAPCAMSYQYPGTYLACYGSPNTKVTGYGQVLHLGGHTQYIYSVTASNVGFYMDVNNDFNHFVTCSIPAWGGLCYYASH